MCIKETKHFICIAIFGTVMIGSIIAVILHTKTKTENENIVDQKENKVKGDLPAE